MLHAESANSCVSQIMSIGRSRGLILNSLTTFISYAQSMPQMRVWIPFVTIISLLLGIIGKVFLSRLELIKFARAAQCYIDLGHQLDRIDRDLHASWALLVSIEIFNQKLFRSEKRRNEVQNAKCLVESTCKIYLFSHGTDRLVKNFERSSARWHLWRRIVAAPVCALAALFLLSLGTELVLVLQKNSQSAIASFIVAIFSVLMSLVILLSDALLLHEYGPHCFDLFSSVARTLRDEGLDKQKTQEQIHSEHALSVK